jgi:hypothetical protein
VGRGQASTVGDVRVSANGYSYTNTFEGWRLTHHLVAEAKYRRKIRPGERVIFKDRNRTNFDPDNILVHKQGATTKARKIAQLKARIKELEAALEELESE